jgi:hypothetical protein
MKFADMQRAILAFREARIKGSKFAQPRKLSSPATNTTASAPSAGAGARALSGPGAGSTAVAGKGTQDPRQRSRMVGRTVSCAVAPEAMFQHMKGCNNADVLKMVRAVLHLSLKLHTWLIYCCFLCMYIVLDQSILELTCIQNRQH